ncbi:MAG TPA: hypothetical protein VFL61_11315 [Gaiellaceae bacterium]|nr:hypothetical protein [Gaiellaceae bacterium]
MRGAGVSPESPWAGAQPATAAPIGWRDRLRDSWWVAWTFTFFFNWVAFLWVGFRAKNERWIAWGCVYAVPFVAGMFVSESDELWNSWPGDLTTAAGLALGIVSIVHAFAIRRTYIAQRQAVVAAAALPQVAPAMAVGPTAPTRSPATGAARGAVVIGLYALCGLFMGAIVTLVAVLFTDPCLPLCTAPSDYAPPQIAMGIAIAGAAAYLALLVPIVRGWSTNRVWWLTTAGPIGIGVVALLLIAATIALSSEPATCIC